MTTKFNSFDQSPLGAFVESPLGARNRRSRNIIVLVVWLDESSTLATHPPFNGYNNPVTSAPWYRDVDEWNALVSDLDQSGFVAAVFDAPTAPDDFQEDRIIPRNAEIPPGVELVDVVRVPSGGAILDTFLDLVPRGRAPSLVRVLTDASRSFPRDAIQAPLASFLVLLERHYAPHTIDIELDLMYSENWLAELIILVREFVPARR